MTDPPRSGAAGEDFDRWLAMLANREPANGSDPVARQAGLLRKAIQENYELANRDITGESLESLHYKLTARLEAEGLLDDNRRKARWHLPIALAASVAVLAIAVSLVRPLMETAPPPGDVMLMQYGELDTMRGEPSLHEIPTANPDKISRQLASRLEALDIPFELTAPERGPSRVLIIQIDGIENQDLLLEVLETFGLNLPETSLMVLHFIPDQKR